jgi:hypothetical protein
MVFALGENLKSRIGAPGLRQCAVPRREVTSVSGGVWRCLAVHYFCSADNHDISLLAAKLSCGRGAFRLWYPCESSDGTFPSSAH